MSAIDLIKKNRRCDIILKQRKIIQIQDELLTEAADRYEDDAFYEAIKELQDEKEKIIKEA